MRAFSGFSAGMRAVRLPEPFFSQLLPLVDDLDELKVILHVLYRLAQQEGRVLYVSHRELLADSALLDGLGLHDECPPAAALRTALQRAVERGALLRAETPLDGRPEEVYFANTPRGRAALDALRRGELLEQVEVEARPNIFGLYEENIGALTPLIAEELKEAEQNYPGDWIEAAFREAVAHNKRSWKYIGAILERWHEQGRKDEAGRRDHQPDARRYIEGPYGEFIEH